MAGNTLISLGGRSRIDFIDRLGMGGYGSKRINLEGWGEGRECGEGQLKLGRI